MMSFNLFEKFLFNLHILYLNLRCMSTSLGKSPAGFFVFKLFLFLYFRVDLDCRHTNHHRHAHLHLFHHCKDKTLH